MSGVLQAVIMLLCLTLGLVVMALLDTIEKLRKQVDIEKMRARFEADKAWHKGYDDCKKWMTCGEGDGNAFE